MNEVTVFLFWLIVSMTAVCGRLASRGTPTTWGFPAPASPAWRAFPGDLGEPDPGRRQRVGRRRDQPGHGQVLGRRFGPAAGEPPLGAPGQRLDARGVRGTLHSRVVLEVAGAALR